MENNGGKVEYKMESWKRTGIFICFIVWIGTFIVGRHMEESSVYKVGLLCNPILLKFSFSEKATKICAIFLMVFTFMLVYSLDELKPKTKIKN